MIEPAAELRPAVTGDAAFQNEVLEDVASAVNYQSWLLSLVEQQLGDDPLEIGSGIGAYAAALADLGQRVTVSEAFGPSLSRLRERFVDSPLVRARPGGAELRCRRRLLRRLLLQRAGAHS